MIKIIEPVERAFRHTLRQIVNQCKVIVKHTITSLPVQIQKQIALLGFPQYCRKDIEYIGNCFNSRLRIYANTRYQIEVNATSRNIPAHEVFLAISKFLPPKSICIDVGANVGTYALGLIGLGADLVYALEPGPYYGRLRRNVRLNSIDSQIRTYQIGLAEENSVFHWAEDLNNEGNAHLISSMHHVNTKGTNTDLSGPKHEVECVSLDSFVLSQGINRIDLIKLDVELMELQVLKGGVNTILKFRPVLIVETSRDAISKLGENTVEKIFSLMKDLDYKGYDFFAPNFIPVDEESYGKDTIFFPNQIH